MTLTSYGGKTMQQNSEDQIIEEIINRIDALRYECGYTINKLAEAADIPESTLKLILSRKQCPKIITIYKLCNAFGIAVWQFFLFPNNLIAFTKEKIDLLNRIDRLNYEQKKAIVSTLEAFETQ